MLAALRPPFADDNGRNVKALLYQDGIARFCFSVAREVLRIQLMRIKR